MYHCMEAMRLRLYDLLGVKPEASHEEIRRAYRQGCGVRMQGPRNGLHGLQNGNQAWEDISGQFPEDCWNSWNQLLELLEALSLEAASRQRRGLQSLPGPLQMQIGSDLQLSRSLVCAFGAF